MYKAILKLWHSGKSKKEISRTLGHNIKTVRKIIKKYQQSGTDTSVYAIKKSRCDDYKDMIEQYMGKGLSNVRIFELLRNDGLNVSYSTLTNFTRKFKVSHDICVRFHSLPGEEAQVDFGYVGRQPKENGKFCKCWVFNMRLSYSRLDYYELVFDQSVETFIRCHINAFNYFNGVPKQVKIDNLKAAVIEASFYEPVYQPLYEGFSQHYNFSILPCRVRKPQEKGKVESGIKYIKNNFFVGRKFFGNEEMNVALRDWLDNYCNKRLHGTTKQRPYDLFHAEEQAALRPQPLDGFRIGISFIRKVQNDCHIVVANNYYSVPYAYVGKDVYATVIDKLLTIYCDNEKIAVHTKFSGNGQFSTNLSHYPKYKNYHADSSEYLSKYKDKMGQIGFYGEEIFNHLVKEHPKMWYRHVTGILSLGKSYSNEVINLSCKRAIFFGATKYSQVKKICQSGAYIMPFDPDNELSNFNIGSNNYVN